MSEFYISTIIPILFFVSCPFAILWRITFVIIDSLNGKAFFESWLHIINKIKDIVPTTANVNPSAIVLRIAFIFRVITSTHHVGIGFIDKRAPLSMCCTRLLLSTTTTDSSRSKPINTDVFWVASTIALAKGIVAICVRYFHGFDNNKFTEPISSLKCWGGPSNKIFHSFLLYD